MRYAIVSDIHSNLHAWKAVLLDIRSSDVEKIICLGDLIGYGPNPAEVLESVHASVDYFVLGNHDAALCGKLDDSLFHSGAKHVLDWTRGRVAGAAVKFLSRMPLSVEGKGFRCAHGDLAEPAFFHYIAEPQDAVASWEAWPDPLMFVGHTHRPAIFLLGNSGIPRVVPPQDFEIEASKRYVVNAGSVGQPRDGETRACYCVYDEEARSVCWRRIPFDIDSYRRAVEDAGLPAATSYFLTRDPRAGVPPLREIVNFRPPEAPEQAAMSAVKVRNIETLRRKVRNLKLLFVLLVLAFAASMATAGGLWFRHIFRKLELAGIAPDVTIRSLVENTPDVNVVSLPGMRVSRGQPIPGWSLVLGNRRRQGGSVQPFPADGTPVLTLESETDADEIRILSPVLAVEPRMKLCMEAWFQRQDDFHGDAGLCVLLTKHAPEGDRVIDRFNLKSPTVDRGEGWVAAKSTFTLPAGSKTIRLMIVGKFTGTLKIRKISLERRS